jgi:hypothetical protein
MTGRSRDCDGDAQRQWQSGERGRIKVAVVLGKSGSEAADVLAPEDVRASFPDFAVQTIADSSASQVKPHRPTPST